MNRFLAGVASIKSLSESILHVYDWQPLIEVESTSKLDPWRSKSFYSTMSFFDKSILFIDEKKSLDLTGLRSLQIMKKFSSDMTLLAEEHQTLALSSLTVGQVLDRITHDDNDDNNINSSVDPPRRPSMDHHHAANHAANQAVMHLRHSIVRASMDISQLSSMILSMEGMSSSKVRHLLNNLATREETRYMEVGSWKGASLCSTLYTNDQSLTYAVAIDNFSQFQQPRKEFYQNVHLHGHEMLARHTLRLIDGNAFAGAGGEGHENLAQQLHGLEGTINVYLYDGAHEEEDHFKALTDPVLMSMWSDVIIVLIDDWNFLQTKKGTLRGLKKLEQDKEYKVVYYQELPARFNGDVEQWWNGVWVGVLQRIQRVKVV